MKKRLINIFIFSSILTTLGCIADGDLKETSVLLRFTEFFAMLGIIFIISSIVYFSFSFLIKNFRKLKA